MNVKNFVWVFQDQRQSIVTVDMYMNAVNPDVNPELSLM